MNRFTAKNLGTKDRLFRGILGLILLILGLTSSNPVLILTGLFSLYEAFSSWCVLYALLNKNTCPLKHTQNPLNHIFLTGLIILGSAIILNFLAQAFGLETWYSFLNQVSRLGLPASLKTLSFFSSLFLFFLYPLCLGAAAYQSLRK